MKIEFDTKDLNLNDLDALTAMLPFIRKSLVTDEDMVSDEGSSNELSDADILKIVKQMHKYALSLKFGQSFKATELYRAAVQGKWIDLSPNTRKAIGRQFKKISDEHYEEQAENAAVVTFKERNIQNTSIYQVEQKESM